jgi:hypothetical protein
MKRTFQLLAIIACAFAFGADAAVLSFGTYNFESGSTAATAPSSGGGVTASSALGLGVFGGVISSVTATYPTTGGFSGGYADTENYNNVGKYIGFVVTPAGSSGSTAFSSLEIVGAVKVGGPAFTALNWGIFSGSGQSAVQIAGSSLAYSSLSTAWPANRSAMSFGNVTMNNGQAYELRFWITGGALTTTLDFDSLTVQSASASPVPEPVNIALCLFALGGASVVAGRRWRNRK